MQDETTLREEAQVRDMHDLVSRLRFLEFDVRKYRSIINEMVFSSPRMALAIIHDTARDLVYCDEPEVLQEAIKEIIRLSQSGIKHCGKWNA